MKEEWENALLRTAVEVDGDMIDEDVFFKGHMKIGENVGERPTKTRMGKVRHGENFIWRHFCE